MDIVSHVQTHTCTVVDILGMIGTVKLHHHIKATKTTLLDGTVQYVTGGDYVLLVVPCQLCMDV